MFPDIGQQHDLWPHLKAADLQDGRVFEFEEFDQLQNGQTYIIEVRRPHSKGSFLLKKNDVQRFHHAAHF